jgi:hypothetical protein
MESRYYEASMPGSYGGVRALARYSGSPVTVAGRWLEKQDPCTLHKPTVKRFLRRKTFAKTINDVFQADLADMRNLFAVAVKDKRGLTVSAAFGKKFVDRIPNMLQTDRGLEFLNAQVQEVFRKNNVHHYYSLNDDIKAALVKRFHRTLKSRLYRYMTHHRTNRWIDALSDVVKSYNSSYHRSIGTAPNDVTPGNEEEIARRLYPPKPPLRYKYGVGNRVRVTKYKHVFHEGYLPNWTHEVFEICERYPTYPVTYGLGDLAGDSIKGKFYEQEIQSVEKRDDDLFEIEKILKTRKRGSRVEYYVKWKGYPENSTAGHRIYNESLLYHVAVR